MVQVLWIFGPVICVSYPLYEIEGDDDNEWGLGQRWGGDRRRTALAVIDECQAQDPLHDARCSLLPTPHHLLPAACHLLSATCLLLQAQDLLYISVVWKLLEDKWAFFGRRVFFWSVFCTTISLTSLTLSLCTLADSPAFLEHGLSEDGLKGTCDAVLLLFVFPIHMEAMPAIIGDLSFFITLMLNAYLVFTSVNVNMRLGHSLFNVVETTSGLLPFIALPFRFHAYTLTGHRLLIGLASGIGWIRFMQDSFKFYRT